MVGVAGCTSTFFAFFLTHSTAQTICLFCYEDYRFCVIFNDNYLFKAFRKIAQLFEDISRRTKSRVTTVRGNYKVAEVD